MKVVKSKRGVWFRELVENCVVYGDRGYRGCEGVFVCDSREMRARAVEFTREKNNPISSLNHTHLFFLSLNALTSCILPKLIHTS